MPKDLISLRIGTAGLDAIEALAVDTGTNRSAALRAVLNEAFRNASVVRQARERLLAE